jgi:hypothetical protein
MNKLIILSLLLITGCVSNPVEDYYDQYDIIDGLSSIQGDTDSTMVAMKHSSLFVWTITGAILVVIGSLACAFSSIRVGIPIVLAGAFAGCLPYVLESEYFSWVAGSTLLAFASLAIWWLYDKIRDNINDGHSDPK